MFAERQHQLTRPDWRLIDAKLTAPAIPTGMVARQALVAALCAPDGARLLLFRAPAGFGKTTLMLQCRERFEALGVATAWLNLDGSDNDATRLLAGLQAAAAVITGECDPPDNPAVPRSVGDLALRVIARLARHDGPFALFLDDAESIREAGVFGLLRELLGQLPPGGRLVIGSRSLPDLRLGRLRARGQLQEVDAETLRFTPDETVRFFAARRGPALALEQVSRLHARTEGWVAALWLAALALERSSSPADFIERFSGTERAVADYLAEDVLEGQPPAVRDFLLHTSILRQLEPALCDALVPGQDSWLTLEALHAAGVLVVPLGVAGDNYRYHSLFAHFLQARLRRDQPEVLRHLHAAAATWYEAQGRPVPAVDHALEAGDHAHALSLLDRHATRLLSQGRMRLLARWFAALPSEALDAHPHLLVVRLWAVCFSRGARQAMALLEGSGLADSTDPQVAPHLRALRPCLLAMTDRYEEASDAGQESLAHPRGAAPFADDVLANAMATIATVMGERDRARRLLDAARRGQGTSVSEFNLMYSEAAEGILDLQEGRLRQAGARFRLALQAAPGHAGGNAWAGVPHAVTLYEADRLEEAAHLLQVHLPLARDVGLPDLVILSHATLSRIAFWRGDVDQSLQLLTELEVLGHKGALPRVVACARLERARLLLRQGHVKAAREELDRADDPELWERVGRLRFLANDLETNAIAAARWQLCAGDASGARVRLARLHTQAMTEGRQRRALALGLLHSAALHTCGDLPAALDALVPALTRACAEGFTRLLLDEADVLRPVMHALAASPDAAHRLGRDPVLADYVTRMASAMGPPPQAGGTTAPALLAEPLTRKEILVLRLLSEGYSNSAMAEKLFVSDSTIRTHLRNINAKLDTHSRTQAVATARRIGVIP